MRAGWTMKIMMAMMMRRWTSRERRALETHWISMRADGVMVAHHECHVVENSFSLNDSCKA